VDEWAARKIQSSFKQYKRQKTGLTTPSPRMQEMSPEEEQRPAIVEHETSFSYENQITK
jgi:hypothetical protein